MLLRQMSPVFEKEKTSLLYFRKSSAGYRKDHRKTKADASVQLSFSFITLAALSKQTWNIYLFFLKAVLSCTMKLINEVALRSDHTKYFLRVCDCCCREKSVRKLSRRSFQKQNVVLIKVEKSFQHPLWDCSLFLSNTKLMRFEWFSFYHQTNQHRHRHPTDGCL